MTTPLDDAFTKAETADMLRAYPEFVRSFPDGTIVATIGRRDFLALVDMYPSMMKALLNFKWVVRGEDRSSRGRPWLRGQRRNGSRRPCA